MDRRLFIGQTAAGIALQLLPLSFPIHAASGKSANRLSESDQLVQRLVDTIQQGAIGQLEQLHLMHVYSPEQTASEALLTLVKRDFALATRLTGLPLVAEAQALFTDSPSATYGSYSASFDVNHVTITWQGMARIGGEPCAATGNLRLFGKAGVLQLSTTATECQLLDLHGRSIPMNNTQSILY